MSWLSRVTNVFRAAGVDRALDEEITFHLESRIDDLVAGGMTREAAEAMARRQFGNRLHWRDSSRDVKLMPWLDDLGRDLRHGFRALRRTPVFASVAILTLALGIGANTAILSIVNGVLLRPADVMTLAIVIPLIVGMAALACWLPAWRASRLDPNVVLRMD